MRALVVASLLCCCFTASAQTVTLDPTQRFQTIDGFGTATFELTTEAQQAWWPQLYFDDLAASMVRVDLTPAFASKYAVDSYCSPWFGQSAPLNLDTIDGGQGPDGTRTRQYTGISDYSTAFGGCSAPIAVMGPDIDANQQLFDFSGTQYAGLVAQAGTAMASQLGGFKLYGSILSPAPWLKLSSGNTYVGGAWPLPTAGVAYPFIWGANFSGGLLDTSGTALAALTDSTNAQTSALTQFARGVAAYLHGFQSTYGVQFYGFSLQNELNFEEFYSSATYPLAAQYLATLKAVRTELDSHSDLAAIKILGPEDLLGSDAYALWQYGSGATEVDKNLKYLTAIAADTQATAAIGGFAIHAYNANGATAAGANTQQWSWWADGWTTSPAAGIPANVTGFTGYDKSSWMTETSGEDVEWLASDQGSGGAPDLGAFSIPVKIHYALTAGLENAWIYLALTDGKPSNDSDVSTLTDATQLATAAKYNAAKHFFKYIRPGAVRIAATVTGSGAAQVLASAYVLGSSGALTAVLINQNSTAVTVSLAVPGSAGVSALQAYTSSNGSYWQGPAALAATANAFSVPIPGYGVVTLTGAGAGLMSGSGTTATSTSGATSGVTSTATTASTSGATSTSTTSASSGTTSTSGHPASSTGASGAATGTGSSTTGQAGQPGASVSGGCGCTATHAGSFPELLALFALANALRRRRRDH